MARGRLTVFLGYAENTGKVAAMLQAGAEQQAEGLVVAAAFLDARKAGPLALPAIAPRHTKVGGLEYLDLDLEAVLGQRPEIVLVQDLAHTNGPGSRHHKRYQDVEEMLAAGIDVLTTLNVQRIESLNDLVARLSGITVRETVPDRILDQAHRVELVDLPPAELRLRLQEAGNPDALLAMRELAYRKTAELQPAPVGPITERLLVCVGPGWENRRLLALGRRQTAFLNAAWTVLHVTRGEDLGPTLGQAEELGARVVTLSAPDVAEAVLSYARQNQITRILADKSLAAGLALAGDDIDLYLVGPERKRSSWFSWPRKARPDRQQQRELAALAVSSLAADLAGAADARAVSRLLAEHARRACGAESLSFGLDGLTGVELAAAEWARTQGRPAGRFTDTHAEANSLYLPMRGCEVVGVTGGEVDRRLLETFVAQAGLALERAQLTEASRRHELVAAKEKLQTALLNTVSHDLKTPLHSITGSLRTLRDDGDFLSEAARRDLIENACDEAERLTGLVANLLDLTRLEGGARVVRPELVDLGELVGAARDALPQPLDLTAQLGLKGWSLDFVLMHQVLVNLLSNCARHAPGPVRIVTRLEDKRLWLAVEDNGTSPVDLQAIFEPFTRQGPGAGSGLGLSICRAIVEAHRGRIWAERLEGGTRVVLELP